MEKTRAKKLFILNAILILVGLVLGLSVSSPKNQVKAEEVPSTFSITEKLYNNQGTEIISIQNNISMPYKVGSSLESEYYEDHPEYFENENNIRLYINLINLDGLLQFRNNRNFQRSYQLYNNDILVDSNIFDDLSIDYIYTYPLKNNYINEIRVSKANIDYFQQIDIIDYIDPSYYIQQGQNQVISNPNNYDLYNESQYNNYGSEKFTEGFNEGHETGSNFYSPISNFNQLLKNNDFKNNTDWATWNTSFELENDKYYILRNSTENGNISQSFEYIPNHKYYITIRLNSPNFRIKFGNNITQDNIFYGGNNDFKIYKTIVSYDTQITGNQSFIMYFGDRNSINKIDYVNLIDLTKIYGSGKEPSLEQCEEIFISPYYNFTLGTIVQNIDYDQGYENGYYIGYENGTQNEKLLNGSNNFFQNLFNQFSSILSIEIFPNISIGLVVFLPILLGLSVIVIKLIRG